jgi:hypothetical protein
VNVARQMNTRRPYTRQVGSRDFEHRVLLRSSFLMIYGALVDLVFSRCKLTFETRCELTRFDLCILKIASALIA